MENMENKTPQMQTVRPNEISFVTLFQSTHGTYCIDIYLQNNCVITMWGDKCTVTKSEGDEFHQGQLELGTVGVGI